MTDESHGWCDHPDHLDALYTAVACPGCETPHSNWFESLDDVQFPWNDMIMLTTGEDRGLGIALSAVFDAIQGLRRDLRVMASLPGDTNTSN